MKYTELLQLQDFFLGFKKIDFIKRIHDNVLKLSFAGEKFIFDLSRGMSGIYTAKLNTKNYNAPFDFMLKKYFSNVFIQDVKVLENNRILCFDVKANKAYKSYESKIYFEFTGKNTNVILTDKQDLIIEALRHIEKSYRVVKPNVVLKALKAYKMDDNFEKIKDFQAYFNEKFLSLHASKIKQMKNLKLMQIDKKIENLQGIFDTLEEEDVLFLQALDYRKKADVLFAHLSFLKEYEREFVLDDFEGKKLEFKLEYSPKHSANLFYKKAKKLEQKARNLNLQRENLKEKLEFALNLKVLLMQAQDEMELEVLLPKKNNKKNQESKQEDHIASFYFNEFKICVGKNEKGNEFLLKNAKKDDLWFHVRNIPSAHTLIVSNKQKISLDVLEFAAKLCVSFSKLKKGAYWVDYTLKNFVKIEQKAFVNYTNFKSIKVVKD
ncbi:NFACT RNA binding domain-containing protein [Campylobacter hepaticus]|uniref:NFACT RNA binding domain-containing protein n=1 Tax=Campylobacter hepaticus TaxID=1813019 RepID=UPI0029AC9D0C|nr:NFACT RNA binding domain-containing protein [Campylobacter hepaticus]MDX2330814.1 NFACT RNA binding domain-containing protein [Campylobacter hepaticus]MDX2371429.1 NFACT RNA binding domain-containing protein [Campylobacter hepaticus]MDX2396679.1 NFACT RNA binding domain-containing protein [Campylobacter hepaticus]MDX5508587.1 NFACT RNA binding domain-containing protein [Campylobacter hepaticus]